MQANTLHIESLQLRLVKLISGANVADSFPVTFLYPHINCTEASSAVIPYSIYFLLQINSRIFLPGIT